MYVEGHVGHLPVLFISIWVVFSTYVNVSVVAVGSQVIFTWCQFLVRLSSWFLGQCHMSSLYGGQYWWGHLHNIGFMSYLNVKLLFHFNLSCKHVWWKIWTRFLKQSRRISCCQMFTEYSLGCEMFIVKSQWRVSACKCHLYSVVIIPVVSPGAQIWR